VSTEPKTSSVTDSLFEIALMRLRRRATATVSGVALVSGAAQLPLLACAPGAEEDLAAAQKESWSQDQGQRNTQMVSFLGQTWTQCKLPNTRFGCGSYDVFIKLRVKPVVGADLNWKRVGVTYRSPYEAYDKTAVGYYFTTYANGDEEWHVPVNVPSSSTVLIFDAWYQDGNHHTFFDDNAGEFHIANAGTSFNVLRVEPWLNTVQVTSAGVQGKISVQLADLDFDKEVVLLATTDDWATVLEFGIGAAGEKNRFSWVEDFPWSGFERWHIDLDLPGDVQTFQYAVGYRHGVRNGATRYEFWDNAYGANYRVERAPEPK
jgi:hypothetical protein